MTTEIFGQRIDAGFAGNEVISLAADPQNAPATLPWSFEGSASRLTHAARHFDVWPGRANV